MVLQGAESSTLSSGMPSVQRGSISRKNSFILVVSHLAVEKVSRVELEVLFETQNELAFVIHDLPSL